jgi:hypothetical protein
MKNTHHQKYRTITNIDPIKGVTPLQLLEQCQYLAKTIPNHIYLNEDDLATAINDTVIYVWKKMESGDLAKHDYSQFKNYLFISLKTNISKENNTKYLHYSKTYETYDGEMVELEEKIGFDYIPQSDIDDDKLKQKQIYNQMIMELSEAEQYVINPENSLKDIMELYPQYNKSMIGKIRRDFKLKCQNVYFGKPIQVYKPKQIKQKKHKLKDQIFELVNQGMSKLKIAQVLGCSYTTVRYHTNENVNEKMKMASIIKHQHKKEDTNIKIEETLSKKIKDLHDLLMRNL